MAKPVRTEREKEVDLKTTIALYLRNWTHQEITDYINEERKARGAKANTQKAVVEIGRSQISKDIAKVLKDWRESPLIDMNEAKIQELERINILEEEAWKGYFRSCEDKEKRVAEMRGGSKEDSKATKQTITREGQAGDTSFLAIIDRCIQRRCKILGLDAPDKVDATIREYGLKLPSKEDWDRARATAEKLRAEKLKGSDR